MYVVELDNLLKASNTCSSTQWPGTACPPTAPGHWVEQQRLVLVGRALALFVVPAMRVVGGLALVAGAWAAVLGKPMGLGRSCPLVCAVRWAPAVVPVLWAPPLLPLLWSVWWAPAVVPALCAPPVLPLLWRAWKVAARPVLPLLWPAWKVDLRLWGGLLGLGMRLGCWSPCLALKNLGFADGAQWWIGSPACGCGVACSAAWVLLLLWWWQWCRFSPPGWLGFGCWCCLLGWLGWLLLVFLGLGCWAGCFGNSLPCCCVGGACLCTCLPCLRVWLLWHWLLL